MIHSFRKFFEFAGRQSRNWYLGLFYEIIRCILEALQFAALLVVLDGLVHDNITAQTALLAFGIMLVSVIGTAIFWYLAHGKEGEGSYRMCEDKRIQIGNRMKYMPMGYFLSLIHISPCKMINPDSRRVTQSSFWLLQNRGRYQRQLPTQQEQQKRCSQSYAAWQTQ